MVAIASARIRNVALVGHGGAGKTSLAEALLFTSGAITRQGRVEDGTTVCDFDPEEVKRTISVATSLATFEHEGHKINLLDCPGYADFLPEVEAALRVADLAVFVVSAVEGVEVQTEIVWKLAESLGLPRMVFVNKEDRERADFERVLAQLQDLFGRGIAPLELPIDEEAGFHAVVDLLTDTAIVYDDDQGHHHEEPVPESVAEHEHEVHDALVEGIVEADDALMERYLEGEVPSPKELEDTLAKGVLAGTVFPVICGSALKDVGVDRLATFIVEIGPSPLDRPPVMAEAAGDLHEIACDPDGQPLAYVWKTLVDRHVGKVSLFRVLSGTLKPDTVLTNPRSHADERLHALFTLRGKEQVPVDGLAAGDLGAVAKLSDTATGDTLAPKGTPVVVAGVEPTPPALTVAIAPRSKGDEDKLMTSLHRLQDEDPSLSVRRDDETHQTLLSGTGETHLAIVIERLARKFGVEVLTEAVRVPYRETITGEASAEGKYKKQAGGHGQYGVASIRIEPLERGAGFQFVDSIVGGAIPRQFIPAVEKGILETMGRGGHFGHPVVDVKVTLFDGKYHSVDSSEMSFKMAGSLGFQEALAAASPVILEPVSRLTVTVPSAYQGEVMGDLNARRGRVQGTTTTADGSVSTIEAAVPTSEIGRYAVDLRSLTGGRGRFTVEHDHYDVLPAHLSDRVARAGASAGS
ncbi:MAG TPA: elongation factor G [Acidimicrobiales bacterium]|nr:elongation factor G [Acidimicrobiales bacterium]